MASLTRYGVLFLVVFLNIPVIAAEPDSTSASPDTTESATLTEFDNGARLLVLPRPDESLVQVDVYLSLRGAARNAGMAHMVEHLMFTSTENCPGGSVRDSLALLATYYQGSTSPRNVHTRTRCLPALLPRLLTVEAERFGRLSPSEADLAHEKKRVLGEQDFRKEAYTSQALGLRIIAMAYAEDEGGDPLIGTSESIGSVGLAEVDTFITRWMRTDRMVVMVSGPVDPDSVAVLAGATFGSITPKGEEPTIGELPPSTEARRFVTRTENDYDLLAVGFRLPYRTPEEAAIVHLTETIMEREDGHPRLVFFEDEALLVLQVAANWSEDRTDEVAAEMALEQFWKETRTVIRRVGDTWLFKRNRKAHVEDFTKRLKQPYRRTIWRAQRLADDRDMPEPEVLAAMVDTLGQDWIRGFFADHFVPERAFTAFAAGRTPDHQREANWNRGLRFAINPYLVPTAKAQGLDRAGIDPILEAAALTEIGRMTTVVLRNDIPVHVLPLKDTKNVYLGGVRTFPCLEDEARSRSRGRLYLYTGLVGVGYDAKGSRIHPTGNEPGGNVEVDANVNSFMITANGKAKDFKKVTAHMHKRVKVDKLNPYAFEWYVDQRKSMKRDLDDFQAFEAYRWRMRTVLGEDHPMAGWFYPDFERMPGLSIGKMNKLHKGVAKTGNLQMVVAGQVDSDAVMKTLDPGFGKRPRAESGRYHEEARPGLGVEGKTIHDESSQVATLKYLFPPYPLGGAKDPGPVHLLALSGLLETRLRMAVETADLDSVTIHVRVSQAGAGAMGRLIAVCPPEDAAPVQELVKAELNRLVTEPPSHDEEARARLQVLGPLVEDLLGGRSARDLLLEFGLFGKIPADPLAELHRREYGLMASWAAAVFPHDRYAWTLVRGEPPEEDLESP